MQLPVSQPRPTAAGRVRDCKPPAELPSAQRAVEHAIAREAQRRASRSARCNEPGHRQLKDIADDDDVVVDRGTAVEVWPVLAAQVRAVLDELRGQRSVCGTWSQYCQTHSDSQ